MAFDSIFEKDIRRPIEGVIKADDESQLETELQEYVLTNEAADRLTGFLEDYNQNRSNGAWLSGFFGSGKSHLLKMLAVVLENRVVNEHACARSLPAEVCVEPDAQGTVAEGLFDAVEEHSLQHRPEGRRNQQERDGCRTVRLSEGLQRVLRILRRKAAYRAVRARTG